MNQSSQTSFLLSMTGYGAKQMVREPGVVRCEIRSVNSRYLEVQVRGPRELLFLEHSIAALVKTKVERGKIDVFLDIKISKDHAQLAASGLVAAGEVDRYLNRYQDLEKKVRQRGFVVRPLDLQRLLSDVGILSGASQGEGDDSVFSQERALMETWVFSAVEGALEALIEVRKNEGRALTMALKEPFQILQNETQHLLAALDGIRQDLKETHRKRLEAAIEAMEVLGDPSQKRAKEERIVLELALLQDKQDIAEELTRLQVHLNHLSAILNGGERDFRPSMAEGSVAQKQTVTHSDMTKTDKTRGQGKKLDFLCQEMFREINTMSNKLIQLSVLEKTMSMKEQVERIRQQIQNIE